MAFFLSWGATLLVLRYTHLHARFSSDHDLEGVQKLHVSPVPRIGGVPLLVGVLGASLFAARARVGAESAGLLLVFAITAFASGLLDDLTMRV